VSVLDGNEEAPSILINFDQHHFPLNQEGALF